MKIKDGFLLREVAGSYIVVPIGAAELDFGGMMTLNEVGALIWRALENGATEPELVQAVLEAYDVEAETAKRDVHRYVTGLMEKGVLED